MIRGAALPEPSPAGGAERWHAVATTSARTNEQRMRFGITSAPRCYPGRVPGPDLSGAVLDDRYQVIEPIAEGAMGAVYRVARPIRARGEADGAPRAPALRVGDRVRPARRQAVPGDGARPGDLAARRA